MAGAVIKKCSCNGSDNNVAHAAKYQDNRYGKGNRVMNINEKKSDAKCTVCGKSHKM